MLRVLAMSLLLQSADAPLPGAICHAAGRGIHFYASAWADTCDCSTQMGVQPANGSFCDVGAKPPPACAKLACNTSLTGSRAATCVNLSNVLPQPVFSDSPWTAAYTQPLNVTVPAMLAATHAMPVGQRLFRLHEQDVDMTFNPADRVLLPKGFSDCASPGWYCTGARADPSGRGCEPFPSFVGVWWDASVSARRAQSFEFFGAFAAAGGVLDQLVMDTEQSFDGPNSPPPSNTTNMTRFLRCNKAMWTAIQDDPRFPPVQRALHDMGFVANFSSKTWLYDEMIQNSKSWAAWTAGLLNPKTGRGMNRAIWDAVDVQRHSRYYQVPLFLLENDDFILKTLGLQLHNFK